MEDLKATKIYPLESIAPEHRHMNYWDMFATWVGANANWNLVYRWCHRCLGLWGGVKALIGSAVAYVFLSLLATLVTNG